MREVCQKIGKINEEFNIPYYIFEEIVEYIEQTAQGRCRCMKWENIKALLNCAKVKRRLTQKKLILLLKNIAENKNK